MEEKQEEKKELGLVEETYKAAQMLKAENDRRENLLKEEQKLQAERLLAGTAGAGVQAPQLTEEQQKKQEAKEFWKGTGIDDAIEKYNG